MLEVSGGEMPLDLVVLPLVVYIRPRGNTVLEHLTPHLSRGHFSAGIRQHAL
jgi:hypothetical protein